MPSEFYNLTLAGFRESKAMMGVNVTCEAVTKRGISTPLLKSKGLEQQGYLPGADIVIELERTDVTAMGIVDRSELVVDGSTVEVLMIDDDQAEPCVRFTCKHAR